MGIEVQLFAKDNLAENVQKNVHVPQNVHKGGIANGKKHT